MTGTSMDAIDVAIIRVAQHSSPAIELIGFTSSAFDSSLAACLARLQVSGPNELDRASQASVELARAIAQAVKQALLQYQLTPGQIHAIGVHGQTVRHRPDLGYSVQLNQPAHLAELTGIAVVSDFRNRDIAAGGQGAPLVPAFHHALFAQPDQAVAVVNIGGMANISWLGESVMGHDTGPGNVLLDLVAQRYWGQPFDRNGDAARGGRADPALLKQMLTEPFFSMPAPKSTGRDLFHEDWLNRQIAHFKGSPADLQATLVELTAVTIALAIDDLAQAEKIKTARVPVLICGGGVKNGWLMNRLQAHLSNKKAAQFELNSTEIAGWPPQAIESAAFAWLAHQALHHRPGNTPRVTGAKGFRILGSITPAN